MTDGREKVICYSLFVIGCILSQSGFEKIGKGEKTQLLWVTSKLDSSNRDSLLKTDIIPQFNTRHSSNDVPQSVFRNRCVFFLDTSLLIHLEFSGSKCPGYLVVGNEFSSLQYSSTPVLQYSITPTPQVGVQAR